MKEQNETNPQKKLAKESEVQIDIKEQKDIQQHFIVTLENKKTASIEYSLEKQNDLKYKNKSITFVLNDSGLEGILTIIFGSLERKEILLPLYTVQFYYPDTHYIEIVYRTEYELEKMYINNINYKFTSEWYFNSKIL
jgi:hypothetical protein